FKILQIRGEVLFYALENLMTLGLKNVQNAQKTKGQPAKKENFFDGSSGCRAVGIFNESCRGIGD
ncbi:hypothetical protein P4476_04265, partial [Ureibacillus terrenus]|nr:hypothetical protein [Ureibacillus terrenus]